MREVNVPTDHAVAIARWYESAITVMHVFFAAPVAAYAPGAPGFQSIVLTATDRDRLLIEMNRFIETESSPGVAIEAIIREGSTAGEILRQAADLKADLLIMGTHGRSGFERLLLGSITEKVVRKGNLPGTHRAPPSFRWARDTSTFQTDSLPGGLFRPEYGVKRTPVSG